jgi:nicotinate-nucleotide--dimethylbenzimidazole phosphoribosyltransferase
MAIVNAGVLEPIKGFPASREVVLFVDQPIRHGTRNFLIEPALTFEELDKAIELGFEVGRSFIRENDLDLLVVGEMGIGNTTSASVLTAWLLGLPAESVVGHGADLPPERLKVKQSVVKKALQVWGDRVRDGKDALAYWGGLEIGAMIGAFFACGVEGVAGVVDGFIATVAAAWAVQFAPDLKGFLIASHESAEPGHRALLQRFGWEPLLQWGMRLGEGTGALMVVPLLRLAVSFHKEVWTFSSLGLRRGG